jgi:putative hydrolase of the HAD superfamily
VGLGGVIRAVLLDALGTLVELPDPAPALIEELAARGVKIRPPEAKWAIGAEIAFYRAHLHHARNPEGLADLRERSTEVLRGALPAHARGVDDLQGALLAALRFRPYPEVPAVLERLRAEGLRLVVVSNWDVSLHEVLARIGLAPLLDGAIDSAGFGAAKPDPSIFAAALELAGAEPSEALHAGDDLEADYEGARRAGLDAVLVARDGAPPPGVRAVRSLDRLPLA